MSAVRLFEECRAAGYVGGYSQLKAYVARIRPRPAPEPIVRFETAPGHQAQFDFAKIRFPWGTRFALLVVLGYSCVLFVDFVARQTALTVMVGLERAFAAFGGFPHEILFDQMKSVIVDHRPTGGRLLENPPPLLPHREHPRQQLPDAGTPDPRHSSGQHAPQVAVTPCPPARPAGGLSPFPAGLAAPRVCNSRRRKCAIQIGVDTETEWDILSRRFWDIYIRR